MGRPARTMVSFGVGYLLGTFPSADLASRAARRGADVRSAGTGNPGAANAIAVLGPRWGAAVLVADIGKATLAAGAGRAIAGDGGAHAAATAAVVGHCFPVQRGFRGGKGVACSAGQCLATFPAYFPFDLLLALLTSTRPWRSSRTHATTVAGCAAWVAAAVVWWRRRWPNLWGPRPTAALPLAALASSVVILERFAAGARAVREAR